MSGGGGVPGLRPAAAGNNEAASRHDAIDAAPERGQGARFRYRSAYFPLALAALSASALAILAGVPALIGAMLPAAASQAVPGAALIGSIVDYAAIGLGGTTALALLYAGWEAALFTFGVAARGKVSDREFWSFIRKELRGWTMHPSVYASLLGPGPGRGLLRAYRPMSRFSKLAFAFTGGGKIYIRPELVRTPWLFRWILKHELRHLKTRMDRGPPKKRKGLAWLAHFIWTELRARLGEWRRVKSLRSLRLPILERVLAEVRLSLRMSRPYDMLIVDPSAEEMRSPEVYERLSGGRARIEQLEPVNGQFLAKHLQKPGNAGKYRVVVYGESFEALPERESAEGKRLRSALGRLDEIYMLSRTLQAKHTEIDPDSPEVDRLKTLMRAVGIRSNIRINSKNVGDIVDEMYYKVSRQMLEKLGMGQVLESLYHGMHYRGVALFPFAEGDPGLGVVERMVRYWRAKDTGGFVTQRVDLPEGGHVLVARRVEPRVDLWLRPKPGNRIKRSKTNVEGNPRKADHFLRQAGFDDGDLKRFHEAGMVVRHVFGDDVGVGRIFVTVRKKHAKVLKRYADEAGIQFHASQRGFQLHLLNSGPIQTVDKAWKLAGKGDGGRIYDIDTGLDVHHPDFADREMESVDFVDEGPEDWIGHGSHKAGISYANGTLYRGMAPHALGRMGKVFAQHGFGSSDGDIMAAAVDAMKWGADVISLSLGSPGTVEAPLAEFFSQLTRKKNAKGEYPIITASAGNAGPFTQTRSQPSVGEFVLSIMAAAKSLDDGVPEVSFFSSVGPTMDNRFGRKRYRRPLGLTALGGDIITPPGARDVYSRGIESVKSKDMPPSPSDAEDGLHTRMSGTSMSNPMIAAIALLVKQAVAAGVTTGSKAYQFFMGDLPFAVNMILMRSARDMGVPMAFQEGGFVDAEAAIKTAQETFEIDARSAPRRFIESMSGLFFRSAKRVSDEPVRGPPGWDWIRRVREVWRLEDSVYKEADVHRVRTVEELTRRAGELKHGDDAPLDDVMKAAVLKQYMGNAGNRAFNKRFNEIKSRVVPKLIEALKDDVWLVRMYAAHALLNLKASKAAPALAEAALSDPDPRVRQTAFMAIAETQTYSVDEALKQAVEDKRADVRAYSAYVLARHGDTSAVDRIIEQTRDPDKRVRHTAVWLLGQLGRRAPSAAADALGGKTADENERGNLRHLSVASLTNMVMARAESISTEAILSLLAAAGPQDFALTRTIFKFFSAASRSTVIQNKMREEPIRDEALRFVHKYKHTVHQPGALGRLVETLARMVGVSLEAPTPLPNPTGMGVPGVDPNLGPVHLILEIPEKGPKIQGFMDFRGEPDGKAAARTAEALGMDGQMLERFGAELQTAMPHSQSIWVNVPDAKVLSFSTEMESRGYRVRRAAPMYRMLHETGPLSKIDEVRKTHGGLSGKGVLVAYLDEGGDVTHPALAEAGIKNWKNFTDDGRVDDVGKESVSHGTHGMGIVGGTKVDGSPYEGMAPGVEFAIGKVLGATGGSEATVMAGMEWAASLVKNPLKQPLLINLSLGGPGDPDGPIGRLVNRLALRNIGVIAAAGNSGPMEGTVASPANAPLAIAIGAVDKQKGLADYSARSVPGRREISWVDFGGAVFYDRPNFYEIVSALSTRLRESFRNSPTAVRWKDKLLYHTMSGTSMAAPHTTGKMAVLIERMMQVMEDKMGGLPDGYLLWITELIESNVQKLEGRSEHEVGAGLIDVPASLKALDEALKDPKKLVEEAAELKREAEDALGDVPPVPSEAAWMGHFSGMPGRVAGWGLAASTLFLLP